MYPRLETILTANTNDANIAYHQNKVIELDRAHQATMREQDDIAAGLRRLYDIDEINRIFTKIHHKINLMKPVINETRSCELDNLSAALRTLQGELIADLQNKSDDLPVKTARQLLETMNITLDPFRSNEDRAKAIQQFDQTARNSYFSHKTKNKLITAIGITVTAMVVVAAILAAASIVLAFPPAITMLPPMVPIIAALVSGTGKTFKHLINAEPSLEEKRSAPTSEAMKAMIRSRHSLHQRDEPMTCKHREAPMRLPAYAPPAYR